MPIQLLIGALLGATLVGLLWLWLDNKRKVTTSHRQQDVLQIQNQWENVKGMIDSLDVAIAVYDQDGLLQFHNATALALLGEIPESLPAFFERFGQGNDLQANYLLHSRNAHCVYSTDNHSYAIEVQKRSGSETATKPNMIMVSVMDVTRQEQEYQQKRDFVANVSHELRTPLTTIKTYTESLLDWGLREKQVAAVRKDIKRVYEDSLRMEKLIEDLLLLSSLDSCRLYTRIEQLEPSFLLRQVIDRVRPQAEANELTLNVGVMQSSTMIYADRSALERVIENIIGNACKYTKAGGSISVYLGYLNKEVYIKVQDTGRGISEEDQTKIFDRFYRVDRTGSRQQGGTGLGLSIARELVSLHQGRILVTSTIGKGTEFTIMIPSAERVINEAFRALRSGTSLASIVHQAAANDLEDMLEDITGTRDFCKCESVFTNLALEKLQANGENK